MSRWRVAGSPGAGRARGFAVLGPLAVGGAYWLAVSAASGVAEPWDGDGYWRLWYPLSLLLAAGLGYLLAEDGWPAGALLTVAQIPVVWLHGGTGPLVAVGLLFTAVLAVPATAISFAAGLVATRMRAD